MADLNDYYWFALVVEHNGFSATERATDIPKSKLSRRVQQLEQDLGVRLIQRTSRQFAVTDIGRNIYRHAQAMRVEMQAAEDIVHQMSVTPRGVVRVSVPVSIAQNELAQLLPAFLKKYPDIQIQLTISNRRVDLINEGIDIALRVRSNLDQDNSFIIRRFGQIHQFLVASTSYLNQFGRPENPEQLIQHATLSMDEDESHQHWELQDPNGMMHRIKINPKLRGSDLQMLSHFVDEGLGIALLPASLTAAQVRSGLLEIVLSGWTVPQGTFHAVYPSKRGLLPAVRVFIEYLATHMPDVMKNNEIACMAECYINLSST